jgi:hypothetical protein
LATKLGIKGLTKATSNITSRVSSIVDEISAATSKVIKPKVTQLKQAVKPKVTQLKQGLQTVGSGLKKGLTSKSGQVATAAGLTYGINKATGGSTEALGGAFVDKEGQITDLLVSNNSGWDVNDLP